MKPKNVYRQCVCLCMCTGWRQPWTGQNILTAITLTFSVYMNLLIGSRAEWNAVLFVRLPMRTIHHTNAPHSRYLTTFVRMLLHSKKINMHYIASIAAHWFLTCVLTSFRADQMKMLVCMHVYRQYECINAS